MNERVSPIAAIIAENRADLSHLSEDTLSRLERRIQGAYWIGANDCLGIMKAEAERRGPDRASIDEESMSGAWTGLIRALQQSSS